MSEVMEFLTDDGATVEITAADVEAYRAAGDAFFAARERAAEPPGRVKPVRLREQIAAAEGERRSWNTQVPRFAAAASGKSEREQRNDPFIADVLEWGGGTVLCPACADAYPGAALRREEACWDGVHRRRFACPAGHLLWTTPENVFGEVHERGEFGWRPARRAAPWLPWR